MRHSQTTVAGWLAGLGALLAVAVVWSASVGSAPIGPGTVAGVVLDRLGLTAFQPSGANVRTIVLDFRLPRVAMGAVVGIALATAGTVMQGFFRNPLADPSIIGVSSGAAAGAVLFIVTPIAVPFGLPVAAVAGGLLTAFGVYLIATEDGRTPVATLLLAGVAIQTFLGALVSLLMIRASDQGLRAALTWLLGSLAASTWAEVSLVAGVTLVSLGILLVFGRDLNVLLLGEGDARALGVEVRSTKRLLLAVSAILTAVAVMFVGVIGFVGLVVPHVMRLLVGPDHRVLLPTSALAGGAFLVAADTVSRLGAEILPVGVVTALVGAPFFLYLLRQREVYAL
jgi:iron complex transport system permease protein